MSLKSCPKCHAPGHQRRAKGFVCCSDPGCPIHNISIPLAAWQSWPRQEPETNVNLRDAQQRREITRLQERLEHFGNIEQQNIQLLKDHEDARAEQRRAEAKLKAANNDLYTLRQRVEKITADRDTKQLELKKITDWAVGGAQVSWASGNDVYARFFEEALELMGKRDASKVPCETCGDLPSVHTYHNKPSELSCRCGGRLLSARAWLERQRAVKLNKTQQLNSTAKTDEYMLQGVRNNIARMRQPPHNTRPADVLQADQTELLLRMWDLLRRQHEAQ